MVFGQQEMYRFVILCLGVSLFLIFVLLWFWTCGNPGWLELVWRNVIRCFCDFLFMVRRFSVIWDYL